MKYRIVISPRAEANIRAAHDYIAQRSPRNAAKWFRQVYEQIDGLELFPRRFGMAREQAHFPFEIRQVVFKSHRIGYTIDERLKTVHVLFVRHGAMREIGSPQDDADDSAP